MIVSTRVTASVLTDAYLGSARHWQRAGITKEQTSGRASCFSLLITNLEKGEGLLYKMIIRGRGEENTRISAVEKLKY
jgi:hypothetical protein